MSDEINWKEMYAVLVSAVWENFISVEEQNEFGDVAEFAHALTAEIVDALNSQSEEVH